MALRHFTLDQLILSHDDPALESMRRSGLFDDLAAHHARLHHERVGGPITITWTDTTTVEISYPIAPATPPHHHEQIPRSHTNDVALPIR
ncbi:MULTISPECIES: hypothetical protein [Nocardiaceae]|uniref:Uncharacterized protein n=1 Tax=Williamsia limnetica TaxID=882452 RepID=A0A318R7P7_WILLI|nr:hypothetical protein [Williamsia limnetica]PYE11118.1 hypothetical protein DFR67_1402 [Williamsia limnetica]